MKIGIIGAMDVEIATILENIENDKTTTKTNMTFHEGRINGIDVVVVKCGIGKVSSAMCVQILADLYNVTHILNTGVAGSLNNRIDIGDIVIGKTCVYHDVDATNFGYALGEVPSLGHKDFSSDETLSLAAKNAIEKTSPEITVYYGRIASGDAFIRTEEKKDWIKNNFQADCCEMESTSIAQACTLNNIPFVILRAISDKADEETEITYEEFEKKAAIACAKATLEFLDSLN